MTIYLIMWHALFGDRMSIAMRQSMVLRTGRGSRGFSLVELVVVLGLLMILASFIAPSLQASRDQARLGTIASQVRQDAASVIAYAGDWRDTYPIGNPLMYPGMFEWYKPLVQTGVFRDPREADELGMRLSGEVTVKLSAAMFYDPRRMAPGQTVPVDRAFSTPIRIDQVRFPANKGMMLANVIHYGPSADSKWCCAAPIAAPVAMADGSIVTGTWQEFLGGRPWIEEITIGQPVLLTWYGCEGRDR